MSAQPTTASRRVLVVDDSSLIREAAKIALASLGGWDVLCAEGGEEALALAAAELPDAILLDVVMPGMDGIEVAERLAGTPGARACPIVLLTARDRPEDHELFGRLPIAGVITKPFDVAALADQLAETLGWES